MGRIQTKNEQIYYSEMGNLKAEKSLVFIPGSGMTEKLMSMFSSHFSEYHTITLDLPEHGQSTGMVQASVDELTESLEEAIRELHAQHILSEKIIVLGYSLGGMAAISLGLIDMPQIEKVVVISSCASTIENPLRSFVAECAKMDGEQIGSNMCGSKSGEEKRKEIIRLFDENSAGPEVTYKDLCMAFSFNKLEEVSQIKKPMLVVVGDEDKIIQPKDAKETAQQVPNATWIEYAGFGHGLPYEHTDQVVMDIKAFIEK